MTPELLQKCLPAATAQNVKTYCIPLTDGMIHWGINDNNKRIAAFLAQVAHESGSLRYMKELASGAEYDTGKKAQSLGNTPEADGDGQKYKGRGPIQLTGHENYRLYSIASGVDCLNHPELLELPEHGCDASAWFWKVHGLNELADIFAFEKITKRINGGLNGYEQRLAHYERIRKILGV